VVFLLSFVALRLTSPDTASTTAFRSFDTIVESPEVASSE
jgi:hypothetical protein